MKLSKKFFGRSTFYEYHFQRHLTDRDWVWGNGSYFQLKVKCELRNKREIKRSLSLPVVRVKTPAGKLRIKLYLLKVKIRRLGR